MWTCQWFSAKLTLYPGDWRDVWLYQMGKNILYIYVILNVSHRRGSNVSLTLDMCTPGCTEPYGYGAQLSPRDQSAQEYLRQGTHVLTPAMLHTRAMDDQNLQAEFYVSVAAAAAAAAAHPPTRL